MTFLTTTEALELIFSILCHVNFNFTLQDILNHRHFCGVCNPKIILN